MTAQNNELTQMSAKSSSGSLCSALWAGNESGSLSVVPGLRCGQYLLSRLTTAVATGHRHAPLTGPEVLVGEIQALSPKDDRQRMVQTQALTTAMGLIQTRWLMYEQGADTVSGPMLTILVFWLAAIFVSFGLFAPRNATRSPPFSWPGFSFGVNFEIFFLEMYTPFGGLIKLSSAPLRATLTQLRAVGGLRDCLALSLLALFTGAGKTDNFFRPGRR